VVLDEVVADLVHEPIEEREVGECSAWPLDPGKGWFGLDYCASSLQARLRLFTQLASDQPRRLGLLIKDDPARNEEPRKRQRPLLLAHGLPQFDGAKPVAGERAKEHQDFDDLSTTDRVEESGPTPTNPDPRPLAVVVFTELDAQIADQALLAMCGQRFVAA
jgi:hypothetical protein